MLAALGRTATFLAGRDAGVAMASRLPLLGLPACGDCPALTGRIAGADLRGLTAVVPRTGLTAIFLAGLPALAGLALGVLGLLARICWPALEGVGRLPLYPKELAGR